MDHILDRLTREEKQKLLTKFGSWSLFQRKLGLSSGELKEARSYLSLNVLDDIPPWDLKVKLQRIGSTELFCIIHDCKESELRRKCEAWGIDLKQYAISIGSTAGIGRKGELFFKFVMGEKIIEDMFETNGQKHPFDFRVEGYGLVDVKTSTRYRYRAGTRKTDPDYWRFHTQQSLDCDYFAFIPLDPAGNPMHIVMVPNGPTVQRQDRITLTRKMLKTETILFGKMNGINVFRWAPLYKV